MLVNILLRASLNSSTAMSFHPPDRKDNNIYIYLNSLVPTIDDWIVTNGVANMGNTSSKLEPFQKILSNVKLVHLTPVESKSAVTLKREILEQKWTNGFLKMMCWFVLSYIESNGSNCMECYFWNNVFNVANKSNYLFCNYNIAKNQLLVVVKHDVNYYSVIRFGYCFQTTWNTGDLHPSLTDPHKLHAYHWTHHWCGCGRVLFAHCRRRGWTKIKE